MNCNMRLLEPSRKKIAAGDIFILTLDGERFYYGMVIFENIPFGRKVVNGHEIPGFHGCTFVYIYNANSPITSEIPELNKECLLIPPFATNHQLWRLGYFRKVGHKDLSDNDMLTIHCFEDSAGVYRDLEGRVLENRIEPCGIYSLRGYKSVDDSISRALGVSPLPNDYD